ncbi:hypothetical protein [Roseivirga misakiensis]|nr:hypothetical protein [Roseivirga misakiensis]
MQKVVAIVQNLSLDIAIGAMISCLFIGAIFQVDINNHMLIGLGIAIWLIYTFDHLRDARLAKSRPVNPRHAFHYDYKLPLTVAAISLFIVGVINATFLPVKTIELGLILVLLSGLYFFYIYKSKRKASKEFFAAFVYTAGIFTAPLSLLDSVELTVWLLIGQFFLLACANLMIIPLYEIRIDEQDNVNSLVRYVGASKAEKIILFILGLNVLIVVYFFVTQNGFQQAQYVIIAMTLSLFVLLSKHVIFTKGQLYRIICDGIFFLPGLYFI